MASLALRDKRCIGVFMDRMMGKPPASPGELPGDRTSPGSARTDRRFSKMITLAWLTLGIPAVALASIAVVVLRSERESTAIIHHLNFIALNLQDVLSDLADAEAEERGYLLAGRPTSLEHFERSQRALSLEFA